MFFEDHVTLNEGRRGVTSIAKGDEDFQGSSERRKGTGTRSSFEGDNRVEHSFFSSSNSADGDTLDQEDWLEELHKLTQTERQCPDILPYPESFMSHATRCLAQREKEIQDLVQKEKAATLSESGMRSLLPFFPSDVMELEMQRAYFFITEFLRCRLRKIEVLCTRLYFEGIADQEMQRWEESSLNGNRMEEVGKTSGLTGDGETFISTSKKHDMVQELIPLSLRKHLSKNEVIVADRLALAMEKTVSHAGMHLLPTVLQRLIPQRPYGEGLEILPLPQHETFVFGKAAEELGIVPFGEGADQEIHEGDLFLVPYYTFRPYVLNRSVWLL